MNAPLACPHCKSVLPPDPPGIFYCGVCGKPFTVPGPGDLAREAKKIEDEKRLFFMVGGVFFLIYVMPVLLSFGGGCIMMLLYFLMVIGVAVGSMAG